MENHFKLRLQEILASSVPNDAARERRMAESFARAGGWSAHPDYNCWKKMRSRCNNPNDDHYKYYGGRGIGICERWESFALFIEDMGLRPTPRHSIDRINNDGNYEPANCRWVTQAEQNKNRRKRST